MPKITFKRAVLLALALLIIGAVGRFYIARWLPHMYITNIIEDTRGELLTSGFLLESNRGGPLYATEFNYIDGNDLKISHDEFFLTYSSFYNLNALDRLTAFGKKDDYGQLMFHGKYPQREIFIFDNWYENENVYRIFYVEDGRLNEFTVPHEDFEIAGSYCLTREKIYLKLSKDGQVALVEIDLSTGEKTERVHTISMGHRTFLSGNYYYPERDQLVRLIYIPDEEPTLSGDFWKGLCIYDFGDYSYHYAESDVMYMSVSPAADGNYIATDAIPQNGFLRLDIYSPDLELIERRSVPVPDEIQLDGGWEGHFNWPGVFIWDNVLYSFIRQSPGEGPYYYYAIDLATNQCLRLDRLDIKNRLMDDNYYINYWKLYLPDSDFTEPLTEMLW